MGRGRKLFHMTCAARSSWESRHADGRSCVQVTGAVWATSKKAAAAVFGVSLYEFNHYATEGWPNAERALAEVPDGVLMVRPMDRGATIAGSTEWVRADSLGS